MQKKPKIVACPTCKNDAIFSPDNKFRPFCSERCKLIDLGLWADEEYKISSPAMPNHLDDDLSQQ